MCANCGRRLWIGRGISYRFPFPHLMTRGFCELDMSAGLWSHRFCEIQSFFCMLTAC